MPRERVYARDLMPGDVCVGSGTTVLSYPYRGVRTAANKVTLDVRRRNGTVQTVTWGRFTEIGIARVDKPARTE